MANNLGLYTVTKAQEIIRGYANHLIAHNELNAMRQLSLQSLMDNFGGAEDLIAENSN